MTWYINNEGVADGPYAETTILSFIQEGRVNHHTLVWHAGLEFWQEAGTLQASWWQTLKPNLDIPPKPAAVGPSTHRGAMPLAPSEKQPESKAGGLLKRLFGKRTKS